MELRSLMFQESDSNTLHNLQDSSFVGFVYFIILFKTLCKRIKTSLYSVIEFRCLSLDPKPYSSPVMYLRKITSATTDRHFFIKCIWNWPGHNSFGGKNAERSKEVRYFSYQEYNVSSASVQHFFIFVLKAFRGCVWKSSLFLMSDINSPRKKRRDRISTLALFLYASLSSLLLRDGLVPFLSLFIVSFLILQRFFATFICFFSLRILAPGDLWPRSIRLIYT